MKVFIEYEGKASKSSFGSNISKRQKIRELIKFEIASF